MLSTGQEERICYSLEVQQERHSDKERRSASHNVDGFISTGAHQDVGCREVIFKEENCRHFHGEMGR